MNFKIIGVSGIAGSGKDTFVDLLSKKLPNVKRFALADALKVELNPTLNNLYNIDVFTCEREQKDIVRPVLVAHGKVRRTLTQGRHWIDIAAKKIETYRNLHPDHIICVTDIRYDAFEKDEVYWLKEELKGILVHVSLYTTQDGKQIFKQPPNQDEAENDPKLIKKSNYRVIWPKILNQDNSPDFSHLNIYVEEFIKYLQR